MPQRSHPSFFVSPLGSASSHGSLRGSSLPFSNLPTKGFPAHSAYLCFSSGPPRGLFSHSPSLDLLPFPGHGHGVERTDSFLRELQVCQGDPVMPSPLPSRESPFPIPSRPALPTSPAWSLTLFLPALTPLVAEIYSSQNTSHVCDFAMLWHPFPLLSDEFLPIHHNPVEASVLQHPPCLPHTELPFLWAPLTFLLSETLSNACPSSPSRLLAPGWQA